MSLRFEHSFVVKSAPDEVWAYLTDPYRVAPALPGASITERVDAETYNGGITIKVGPVSARYRGTVRFEALDPAARTAAIVATGQDTSGRGGADMRMQSRLTEKAPGETEVNMVSEVNVTGIMAQFGRGLIQDVSNQMLEKFTGAMRAELEKPQAAASTNGAAGLNGRINPNAPNAPNAPNLNAVAGPNVNAITAAPADIAPPVGAPQPSYVAPQVGGTRPSDVASTAAIRTAAAPAVAAPPIEVISFGSRLLLRAAGRTMRRPLFWIVAVAVAGCLYWSFR